MSTEGTEGREASPDLGECARALVIGEARKVADKALARLRALADQLPEGALEQVERLHEDPAAERRKAARLADGSIRVAVRPDESFREAGGAMRDHCPTGLAVLLPCPAGVGTILRVLMPDELGGGGWVSVEVKYCRKEQGGWVAGCELMSDQPPI